MEKDFPNQRMFIKPGDVERKKYVDVLLRSKASISVRGLSYNAFRYWEIPYYGAMLLSKRTPLIIPHDWVDGESALFFDENEELRQKFEKYVVKSDEWKEIARKGRANYFNYHTPKKLINDMVLEKIRKGMP